MEILNKENLSFKLSTSSNAPKLSFELKTYHLWIPPLDGVVLEFIFETGGV